MKMSKLLISCFLFLFLSCESNMETIETIELENETTILKGRITNLGSIDPHAGFQKKLQWVSYIAAEVIMSDSSYRQEIYNYLQGRETATLEELIGRNSTLNFKDQFISILRDFLSLYPGRDEPVLGTQSPPLPIITCDEELGEECLAPINGDVTGTLTTIFLTSILENNCIELFFPDGINPLVNQNLPFSITSTAHPLNYDDFNYGFMHSSVTSATSDDNGVTEINYVDNNYLNTVTDNVIVARPYTNNSTCTYPEFLLINLSAFLN